MKTATETSGTWLQGHIETTRAELTKAFGEPTQYGEGDKVTIEWGIQFDDGTIATIYDWKRYELGTPKDPEIVSYNIGGLSSRAVDLVRDALSKKISRSVFVEVREWFDKSGGNSYFSARVWVDGHIVAVLPFQYGYGNHFETVAMQELISLGFVSDEYKNRALWRLRDDLGIDFYSCKSYTTKKEMFN